jgi:hypothetical protein
MTLTDRRRKVSPAYYCYWCGIETRAETGFRGYDPQDELMAEFGGAVSVFVCTPACPDRPETGIIHRRWNWKETR